MKFINVFLNSFSPGELSPLQCLPSKPSHSCKMSGCPTGPTQRALEQRIAQVFMPEKLTFYCSSRNKARRSLYIRRAKRLL